MLKSRFLNETMFKSTIANALKDGGAKQDRTADLLRARQALSQLSYSPNEIDIDRYLWEKIVVGLSGLEPPTSRLSGERSNQLSYRPNIVS